MALLNWNLEDNILVVRLNDPSTYNAFSPAMAEEFHKLRTSENHKALILTAASSPYFCSGGNLKHYKSLSDPSEGLAQNQRIEQILQDLATSSVPTLAAVHGITLGGGIELVSAFQQILATPASLFGLWQRRIGLTFGWGGQGRLEERIGTTRTRGWLQQGQTLTAWKAQQWGLVDGIVSPGDLLNHAKDRVNRSLLWGQESFAAIQETPGNAAPAFKKLWMKGRHQEVLKKF